MPFLFRFLNLFFESLWIFFFLSVSWNLFWGISFWNLLLESLSSWNIYLKSLFGNSFSELFMESVFWNLFWNLFLESLWNAYLESLWNLFLLGISILISLLGISFLGSFPLNQLRRKKNICIVWCRRSIACYYPLKYIEITTMYWGIKTDKKTWNCVRCRRDNIINAYKAYWEKRQLYFETRCERGIKNALSFLSHSFQLCDGCVHCRGTIAWCCSLFREGRSNFKVIALWRIFQSWGWVCTNVHKQFYRYTYT